MLTRQLAVTIVILAVEVVGHDSVPVEVECHDSAGRSTWRSHIAIIILAAAHGNLLEAVLI